MEDALTFWLLLCNEVGGVGVTTFLFDTTSEADIACAGVGLLLCQLADVAITSSDLAMAFRSIAVFVVTNILKRRILGEKKVRLSTSRAP